MIKILKSGIKQKVQNVQNAYIKIVCKYKIKRMIQQIIDSYNCYKYIIKSGSILSQYHIVKMQGGNIGSLDIEQLATDACFAINYQIKLNAQQTFYNLCFSLTKQQIIQLMNNYSQAVLFVTMEYIYQVIPKIQKNIQQLCQYFFNINQIAQNWYKPNINSIFIRNNNTPVTLFVQNSIGRTIGQCLKYIYKYKQLKQSKQNNIQYSQQLINCIKKCKDVKYRLYLWYMFICAVSVVDNSLSYLDYRSMVYNFQQNVIPQIMTSLLPFFQSVKDQIEINDLSLMQSHLTVSQQNGYQNKIQINLFNPTQVKFTNIVFQVLKQIMCFNYNITFSQFQSDIPIDNCLVNYPDIVTKKIASRQFLQSIFYVTQKIIKDTNLNQTQNMIFLKITLQCIPKAMLTKLYYVTTQLKSQFIKSVLKCMPRLLQSNKLTQQILLSLIQSNIKFITNVQLHIIKSYKQQYIIWLKSIKNIILLIIQKSIIHIQNDLIKQSLQLTSKLIEQTSAPQMKQQIKQYKQFGTQVIHKFYHRLYSVDSSMIGSMKNRNYQQLQKNLSSFLKRPRQLTCLKLDKTLQLLIDTFPSSNLNAISNIIFILTQLCDCQVLQRNIIYESQDPNCLYLLGILLNKVLALIAEYRNQNNVLQLVQVSMLFFIKKLLTQLLSAFTYQDNSIKLTSQIYKALEMAQLSIGTEQLLGFCYREIANNLKSNDYIRSSYTFQILNTLLLKFKWGIKRQHFRQTSIAKDVLFLCKKLSQTNFEGEMITLRKQLYKIITNISFDDILDDYRTNINELVSTLQKQIYNNRWIVMYDLTGICQSIDTSVIYRYLMITLEKSKINVSFIMSQLFQNIYTDSNNSVPKQIELLKSIFKLQHSMIDNKGQRLAGSKNIFYNYKLISYLMPYWANCLSTSNMIDQDWDQAILQLYKIFITLLKNNNTNFFILERIVTEYNAFLLNLLTQMVNISQWIQLYPTLFIEYRILMTCICKQLMQVIFCNSNQILIKKFDQLLDIFIKFNIKGIDRLIEGNNSMEEQVQAYFQIMKYIWKYLKHANKLQHKQQQLLNMTLLNANLPVKFQFIAVLFKFSIATGKKYVRCFQSICKIIQYMNFFCSSAIQTITEKIGLTEQNNKELVKIWKQNQENKGQWNQDFEDEQFLADIKNWFKKMDTSTQTQIQY